MKKVLKILISVIVLVVLVFVGGIFYLFNGLEAGSKISINGINMSDKNDGVYKGEYKSGRWSNELNVTVRDNKIIDIDIVDDVTFSKPGVSEELIGKVIEEQNTTVDAVSGGTVTSKAYLKSIENAFTNK